MDTWTWFQSGLNTDGAHNPVTDRRLSPGDLLSLNTFPMIGGYYVGGRGRRVRGGASLTARAPRSTSPDGTRADADFGGAHGGAAQCVGGQRRGTGCGAGGGFDTANPAATTTMTSTMSRRITSAIFMGSPQPPFSRPATPTQLTHDYRYMSVGWS